MKKQVLKVELEGEAAEKISRLAERLGVEPARLLGTLADVTSTYWREIAEWAENLRVRRHNKHVSVFEELYYYGVSLWRDIVAPLLERLNAKGRFELEGIDFDPDEGLLEVEMIALEGSDLKADRLVVTWSPKGVHMEVYYYLEEDEEPPRPSRQLDFEWSYLPDEHAIVISHSAETLSGLPPIYRVDREADLLRKL
ncbi:hypothetical protein APE_0214.1 [Aeropyrum pernix K1]|uniref:Uncharacterized protein n=1 Tax=Aeropyrum pernix (strain ATCC 700893 / DSM 11879 / JCM 9820 / NBRC 100138 / K1) TaxID=272557 RepID=Q9YFN5_AERPE|nr:hypothetical protein [Aeropyrum pernix]BAA79126.2 hypothetical protein APE_0214.1 [Aeropyrum pernix K1]